MTNSEIKTIANSLSDTFIADENKFDSKMHEMAELNINAHEGFMIVSLAQLYYNAKTGIIRDLESVKKKQRQILRGEIQNG